MKLPVKIKDEIDELIANLIEIGLSDDQNFTSIKKLNSDVTEVSYSPLAGISVALKKMSKYEKVYDQLNETRSFSLKLPDGALLQMMYSFNKNKISRHRLAFYPSPYLEKFQNEPEMYFDDEIFAEVLNKSVVPFPIRFDYDGREEKFKEIDHPKSHLTLGQYSNCRIPVSAPLTPSVFIDFILRNFYNTIVYRFTDRIISSKIKFDDCIVGKERNVVYMQIPK